MSEHNPLAPLEHRIEVLRAELHAAIVCAAGLSGVAKTDLSQHIERMTSQLEDLTAERGYLSHDSS